MLLFGSTAIASIFFVVSSGGGFRWLFPPFFSSNQLYIDSTVEIVKLLYLTIGTGASLGILVLIAKYAIIPRPNSSNRIICVMTFLVMIISPHLILNVIRFWHLSKGLLYNLTNLLISVGRKSYQLTATKLKSRNSSNPLISFLIWAITPICSPYLLTIS